MMSQNESNQELVVHNVFENQSLKSCINIFHQLKKITNLQRQIQQQFIELMIQGDKLMNKLILCSQNEVTKKEVLVSKQWLRKKKCKQRIEKIINSHDQQQSNLKIFKLKDSCKDYNKEGQYFLNIIKTVINKKIILKNKCQKKILIFLSQDL